MFEYELSCSFVKQITRRMQFPKCIDICFLMFFIPLMTGVTSCGSRSAGETNKDTPPAATTDVNLFEHEGTLEIQDSIGQLIVSLDIEIADDDYTRERGLMYRSWLPEQAGMLFVFEQDEFRSFWMKNTRLSLDILFIDAEGLINTIHAYTVPFSEGSLPSNAPARFVLELNAGFCDNHGIREGMRMSYKKLSGEAKLVYQ